MIIDKVINPIQFIIKTLIKKIRMIRINLCNHSEKKAINKKTNSKDIPILSFSKNMMIITIHR